MPFYRVWYQNKQEPLEFTSAGRTREDEIVSRALAHSKNIPFTANDVQDGARSPSVAERIAQNGLGPVSYTEDESEVLTIS